MQGFTDDEGSGSGLGESLGDVQYGVMSGVEDLSVFSGLSPGVLVGLGVGLTAVVLCVGCCCW